MDDNSNKSGFFLNKNEDLEKRSLVQRNMRALVLFLVSVVYGLFIYFIITMDQSGYQSMSRFALYVYGLIGGLGILLLNRFYTKFDRSQKILTEVLEKSAEARAITDPKGNTIYTNQRFNKLIEGNDIKTLSEFTSFFSNPNYIEKELHNLLVKASPAGSATTEVNTQIKDKNIWLQITCQHIIGWAGYTHWRFDDITPRHLMEATIREEREKLRDFTDNAPVGFFSVNEEGLFTFANDVLLDLLEVSKSDLINNHHLHDFLATPPKDAHPYDCFANGSFQQHGELRMKSNSGKEFKAAITHSITKSNNNKIITRSIVYDLTIEQKMEKALKESEDRFQRLFEEAPIGICILNKDMNITDINEALASILKQPMSAANNKPLVSFIEKEDMPKVKDWLKDLSNNTNEAPFIEASLKGKEGTIVQLYARKSQDSDNFVIHFIDLTERKNLERQFTQSQKMQAVGQLAGGIAHDFNNLLTAMIGFADLLLLRHKPGDPSFSDIMQIKQNSNRAANMVRQLLAFSRQQTLQPRTLDLTDVLTELSHLIRRLIGVNIELNISHKSEQGLIKADQGQMEQVLINLAVNARDAMPEGGKLDIYTDYFKNSNIVKLGGEDILPKGEWVTISVEDSGTGISPDVIARIFEPFFSTKDVGAGTGLGLATVHGIIHQTGGYISVESIFGKGTIFTIYLPKHEKDEKENTVVIEDDEKQSITDLTGTSKILLVEDEDAVRIFSSRALGNKGYEVFEAPSGESALSLINDKGVKPDLLITDVMMPEMDGTTLAKAVKEKFPDIKIIFISGYAEDKFKEHVGGNAYFLPKPFTLKQLATKVKEVIDDVNE